MNIGRAARVSGASAKMIRYYESSGRIPRARRTEAGYRMYTDAEVNTLRFIHRAREFGFPIERIRLLVSLWQGRRPSSEVKRIATEHGRDLRRKIEELVAMADALQELADQCRATTGQNVPSSATLSEAPPPAPRLPGTAAMPSLRTGSMRSRAAPFIDVQTELSSVITCPVCGTTKAEQMPDHACQISHDCTGCGAVLRPRLGDCCIICSYESMPCPPVREERRPKQI